MSFTCIESALEAVGLKDLYLAKFKENEIDDETLEESVKDADSAVLLSCLSSTIPVPGHRMRFIRTFKRLHGGEGGDSKLEDSAAVKLEMMEEEECKQVPDEPAVRLDIRSNNVLLEIKDFYVRQIKKALEVTNDEVEMTGIQSDARKATVLELTKKGEKLGLSSKVIQTMRRMLNDFIRIQFQGTLLLLKMKRDEDDVAVKTALLDSRKYYEEEMEKNFLAKDWLLERDLEELHKKLRDAAIEYAKKEVALSPIQEKKLIEVMDSFFQKFCARNSLRMPRDSYAIGIDLGTTYSCVAVCIRGKIHVIPCDGSKTIPSYVSFHDDRSVSIGEAAKEQAFRRPQSTIFDAKRLIGRKFKDSIVQDDMKLWPFEVIGISGEPRIKIPKLGKSFRPEEVSARVLSQLKKMADQYLNMVVKNAVVTVPAYFSDSQRQATKDAAEIAGLNAIIINEPTAAAIAYYYESHLANDMKRNVLIFDLGGGTFDVAVLELKGSKIEVKAIGGDTHLGGEDFDNEMVKYVIDVVKRKTGIDLTQGKESSNPEEKRQAAERFRRIRSVCEKQKRLLSTAKVAMITIDRIIGNYDLYEPFTREDFEKLNLPIFEKCITVMSQVISEANLMKSDIDDIVLIGGSTRIPKIRQLVEEYFEGKALNSQINADEAVANGAAVQAALEFGKFNELPGEIKVTLSDVTPLSLGIRIAGGFFSRIIPKNTSLPSSISSPYVTCEDWQTAVDICIYEGEAHRVEDNNLLGTFVLKGIPRARRGKEVLDVRMTIDREGILQVKAVCKSTGGANQIKIDAHKGRMTGREIDLAKVGTENFMW